MHSFYDNIKDIQFIIKSAHYYVSIILLFKSIQIYVAVVVSFSFDKICQEISRFSLSSLFWPNAEQTKHCLLRTSKGLSSWAGESWAILFGRVELFL